ncbi:MAG TPA: hypothetical protein VF990_06960 [Candidatus Dormibacteraeota bacterium]
MRKTVHRFARLVPFVAIVAALMVPTVALAADTSIQPQSATLVAKGAEVDVTVSFTCPMGLTVGTPGFMPGIGAAVFLQQAVSKTEQAAGSGFSNGQTCTGQPQTALVPVLANVPGPPFRKGLGVASAFLLACDANYNCVQATSAPVTIRISR